MDIGELLPVAAACLICGLMLFGIEVLVSKICARNAALARWYLLLASLPLAWLIIGLVKARFSEQFNWVPDSIEHDAAARDIAYLLTRGKFQLAMEGVRANNDGFRFLIGILYALTGSPPAAFMYVVNSLITYTALLLLLDLICEAVHCREVPLFVVLLVTMLPTALFWATAINKEALMLMGVVLTFRLVLCFTDAKPRRATIVTSVIGLLLSGFLRPHVAACWFAGLFFGVMLSKRSLVFAMIGCLAFPALFFAFRSFKSDILDRLETEGAAETFTNYSKGGWGGGSEIERTQNPIPVVEGLGMLFLRPFPNEIHSSSALLTSLEIWAISAIILLGWMLTSGRIETLCSTFVVCAAMSVLALSVFFSYMPNLGYMSRQRLQAFPSILVFATVPYLVRRRRTAATPVESPSVASPSAASPSAASPSVASPSVASRSVASSSVASPSLYAQTPMKIKA